MVMISVAENERKWNLIFDIIKNIDKTTFIETFSIGNYIFYYYKKCKIIIKPRSVEIYNNGININAYSIKGKDYINKLKILLDLK